jgi:hypothetical protein
MLNNNPKGNQMTNELKTTYDLLYKQMEDGTAHKQFRSENVSLIEADDNFARLVMETAKSVIKFNKRGK